MFALFNPCYGKIGRRHWWLSQFAIFCLALAGLAATIFLFADLTAEDDVRNPMENVGLAVTIVAAIYMNLCTCLNRLRDSGRTGFWYLSFQLPTVGTGLMFYFCGIEKAPGRFRSDNPRPPEDAFVPVYRPPAQPRTQYNVPPPREFGRRNRNAV
ncbi:DUF805 domain-containing protein [Roseibium sp. MMSF_3412]|uniref:DUF805 domain-containing protein n=1 Tax=Roseibium sp. MMSF_3412 TaxID=3046712 RepID=UPI00273EA56F|nr:DUF805 domain-containing protein [Roseibium sp. MMSF_3412]